MFICFNIKIYAKTHKIALYFKITHREHVPRHAAPYIILFYTNDYLENNNFQTKSD